MLPSRDGVLLNTEHKAKCDTRTPTATAAYMCTRRNTTSTPRHRRSVRGHASRLPHPTVSSRARGSSCVHTVRTETPSPKLAVRRYGDCFKQGLLSPRNYPQFYPPGGSTPKTEVNPPRAVTYTPHPRA